MADRVRHTPGPWDVILGPDGGWSIEVDHPGDPYRVLCIRNPWPHYKDTSLANARLMGAAPDLLEALRQLTLYVYGNDDDKTGLDSTMLFDNASAAIAKATRD